MNDYQIDREKWSRLTIFEQMGNIGAEVGRTYEAHHRNDSARFLTAFSRCMDLFDASAAAWARKKDQARTREILRARDEFAKIITTGEEDLNLERYFMRFALAARRRQLA